MAEWTATLNFIHGISISASMQLHYHLKRCLKLTNKLITQYNTFVQLTGHATLEQKPSALVSNINAI